VTTDDRLRAAIQRRETAQGILARCLRELNTATGQRQDDAVTLLYQLLFDIDGISAEIDRLLEERAIERDPDRMT